MGRLLTTAITDHVQEAEKPDREEDYFLKKEEKQVFRLLFQSGRVAEDR